MVLASSASPRCPRGRFALLGALLLCDVARAVAPDALPVEGRIRAGGIAITRDERGIQIQQTGERAIVDWQSFDIGRSASLRVLQPSSNAMLLNRVLGNTGSTIAGELSANGQVVLVNPNGIHISRLGVVNAMGFVASTLDIADRDFMGGDLRFGSLASVNTGSVVQDGRITIEPGGFSALLGHRIEQSGMTRALLGQVGLGVGQVVRLLPGQERFLEVTLKGERETAADSAFGARPVASLVMTGVIEADGGLVQLAAPMAAVRAPRPLESVYIGGVARARNAYTRSGTIRVDGDGGTVRISGRLDASSNEMHGMLHSGGTVSIAGRQVVLEDEGIDVSGAQGGGQVRIAARYTGADDRRGSAGDDGNAPLLLVGPWARINASATNRGDAGDVQLASDGRVAFLGRAQALSAAQPTGPRRLSIVEESVVPAAADGSAAGSQQGLSVTPPMPASGTPPLSRLPTADAHASRYESAPPAGDIHMTAFAQAFAPYDWQSSPAISAPAAVGWGVSPHTPAPAARAAGGRQPSPRAPVSTPSGWQPPQPASASASAAWTPIATAPVSPAVNVEPSHAPTPTRAAALPLWQRSPSAGELPSLRWTPSPPVAQADSPHSPMHGGTVGLADLGAGSPRGTRGMPASIADALSTPMSGW